MLKKIDDFINYFSTAVMMVTMILATLVAFINVVMRYCFNYSMTWAGELTSYLFIWSALFGAAYGFKIGMHIGVNAILQILKPKIAKIVLIITLIIIFIYLTALMCWGYNFIVFNYEMEQVSVDLQLPFWIIYLCVPITMFIADYQILLKPRKAIRTPSDNFSYEMIMKEDIV